jgi:hypothetical protein
MSTFQAPKSASVAVQLFGNDNVITPRYNKSGKGIGDRLTFGEATASEVRAAFKNEGLKGNALTKAVNEVITKSKDFAWAKHDAVASALRSKGYVPDYTDVSASGKSAVSRYTKPTEPVERVVKTVDVKTLTVDDIKNLSPEVLAALKAMIA